MRGRQRRPTACGTALDSRCCGCRRSYPLGRRTTRQNDGRRPWPQRRTARREVFAVRKYARRLAVLATPRRLGTVSGVRRDGR